MDNKYKNIKSPSKRRVSSVEVDKKLNISIEEIDETIEKWSEVKEKIRILKEKEEKYKKIISKIMEVTNSDIIKGNDHKVIKVTRSQNMLLKQNIPKEIYDKYSIKKEVSFFYVKEI